VGAFFWESSALVKAYVTETGSGWVRSLLAPAAGHAHFACRITAVEVTAALGRRWRDSSISLREYQAALAVVRADFVALYEVAQITPALADEAIDLTEQHPLRAYDAIQLAAALRAKGELAAAGVVPVFLCSDARLTAAAAAEGLVVDDPNLHP
jgi:predicted nucleic acid-binding protein